MRLRPSRSRRLDLWTIAPFLVLAMSMPAAAIAQVDTDLSYFVPQVGPVDTPTEGAGAVRFFRMCPNNDGGTSLPLSARIKVVLRDTSGVAMPDVNPNEICIVLNGGTPAQGFSGVGADSVIANSSYNPVPLCPDLRCIHADAPTNALGVTYITFGGADPAEPGVWVRDPSRKWGHYDSELPVYAKGVRLSGRLTTGSTHGSYVLRIKSYDHVGGLGTVLNAGAVVSSLDFNSVAEGLFLSVDPTSYWRDFDSSGEVDAPDINMTAVHINHDCDTPNSP